MKRIALRLYKALGEAQTRITEMQADEAVVKLIVRHAGSQIKIEVTPVLRGSVFEPNSV